MLAYIFSVQSEWLKRKNSAAVWLTILGGTFVPLIILGVRFYHFDQLAAQNASADLWERLYRHGWQYMGFLLLPMGGILVTSLITQLETRSNAWKLLHVTPQRFTTIFLAKLTVILVLLLFFFLLFNINIYLTGVVPAWVVHDVPYPVAPFPWIKYLSGSGQFLLACLPIVALQYLLGLLYRNFMLPLGIGLGLYIASVMALSWKYAYTIPYIYCMMLANNGVIPSGTYIMPAGYFMVFAVLAYILYIRKKEKG
ncbi:ABC transporter permease subunit [Chitinophaga sp. G-6-1-13]|uniref:ABC transporter permease subunit n=1 Tax=Chitinophaga fulva TaxID=2728842 RepID=A0A848GU91_9BACT|nr:ABC transporter permease [Chitinophaga fulva]NML40303.1 ABC transporter permease subunit [Chitinophaga fulva]